MTNLTAPLGFDPIVFIQNKKTEAKETLYSANGMLLACLLGITILLGAWGLEWVLTYTVIEANFGPEYPGDPVPMKVYMLSFASIVAIAAFHVLLLQQREHPIAIWLRRIARVMLVVFFVGMALLFLTTDMTSATVEFGEGDLFDAEPTWGQSVWAMVEPFINVTSAAALGGLVFINLALSDAILSWVTRVLPVKLSERRNVKEVVVTSDRLEELNVLYLDHEREEARLMAIKKADLALEAAGRISDAGEPTLQALREEALEAGLIPPAKESPLDKTGKAKPSPNAKVIERFLEEWDEFTKALPGKLR